MNLGFLLLAFEQFELIDCIRVFLVIFCADVRLDYSEFRQSVTAVFTSRTIITENPSTTEAQFLREYAENVPLQPIAVLEHLTQSVSEREYDRQSIRFCILIFVGNFFYT